MRPQWCWETVPTVPQVFSVPGVFTWGCHDISKYESFVCDNKNQNCTRSSVARLMTVKEHDCYSVGLLGENVRFLLWEIRNIASWSWSSRVLLCSWWGICLLYILGKKNTFHRATNFHRAANSNWALGLSLLLGLSLQTPNFNLDGWWAFI